MKNPVPLQIKLFASTMCQVLPVPTGSAASKGFRCPYSREVKASKTEHSCKFHKKSAPKGEKPLLYIACRDAMVRPALCNGQIRKHMPNGWEYMSE